MHQIEIITVSDSSKSIHNKTEASQNNRTSRIYAAEKLTTTIISNNHHIAHQTKR